MLSTRRRRRSSLQCPPARQWQKGGSRAREKGVDEVSIFLLLLHGHVSPWRHQGGREQHDKVTTYNYVSTPMDPWICGSNSQKVCGHNNLQFCHDLSCGLHGHKFQGHNDLYLGLHGYETQWMATHPRLSFGFCRLTFKLCRWQKSRMWREKRIKFVGER